MLTVTMILSVAALLLAIANAINRCPLWVPVVLLTILHLIQSAVPIR
jgi:hypothetical protein